MELKELQKQKYYLFSIIELIHNGIESYAHHMSELDPAARDANP